jgi:hypothetical protein
MSTWRGGWERRTRRRIRGRSKRPVALGSLPIGTVRTAVATSLEDFGRARAFERWTIGEQRRRLDIATCRGDELPEPAAIDLAQYVSFLAVQ